jgi:hypothetical protein
MNLVRRFIYGSEIVLGGLGIIGPFILNRWFFISPFQPHGEDFWGYWFLLLIPTVILIVLASIPAVVLGACGFFEYRILRGRVRHIAFAKIVIQIALFSAIGGLILIYPYSANASIPGLDAPWSQQSSPLYLLIFLWAGLFLSFLYLPVVVKLLAVGIIWIHLIINALDLFSLESKTNRALSLLSLVLLVVPVISPVYLIPASYEIAPPQTLKAANYFVDPSNLGLPQRYRVKDFRWDGGTKGLDARAGLVVDVDDGHTREGVIVYLAFFSSAEKSAQRYATDFQNLVDSQRHWSTGRYRLYVERLPLGDGAFVNKPRPMQLEMQNGKIVLSAHWANTTNQQQVPSYVTEIVQALASNARQDFVR